MIWGSTRAYREETWKSMLAREHMTHSDCFVCKTPLTEGKCMTKSCPKTKDPLKHGRGPIKSDGGPSTYFDLCNGGTLNDELERKGDEQWLGDSFHLGNVVKLAWRWGLKEGTDKAYDANKLIYSGARLLMKYKGVASVRKSLQNLLDDPQFQEGENDK